MTVDYKGSTLFYTRAGCGPCCVFLHGFLENSSIWQPLKMHVEQTHTMICIDLPGHGQSDLLSSGNSIAQMAAMVNAVVEKLGFKSIMLVGHSMGGYVGLAFAKAFPETTNGLFLLNSTPAADDAARKKVRKHGIRLAKENYEAIVSMSIANLFTQNHQKTLENDIKALKIEALRTPLNGYIAGQEAMMQREDLTFFWIESTFKKYMLLGSEDSLIDAETTRKACDAEGVNFSVCAGGHMLVLENLQETINQVIKFLK